MIIKWNYNIHHAFAEPNEINEIEYIMLKKYLMNYNGIHFIDNENLVSDFIFLTGMIVFFVIYISIKFYVLIVLIISFFVGYYLFIQVLLEVPSYAFYLYKKRRYFSKMINGIKHSKDYLDFFEKFYPQTKNYNEVKIQTGNEIIKLLELSYEPGFLIGLSSEELNNIYKQHSQSYTTRYNPNNSWLLLPDAVDSIKTITSQLENKNVLYRLIKIYIINSIDVICVYFFSVIHKIGRIAEISLIFISFYLLFKFLTTIHPPG